MVDGRWRDNYFGFALDYFWGRFGAGGSWCFDHVCRASCEDVRILKWKGDSLFDLLFSPPVSPYRLLISMISSICSLPSAFLMMIVSPYPNRQYTLDHGFRGKQTSSSKGYPSSIIARLLTSRPGIFVFPFLGYGFSNSSSST